MSETILHKKLSLLARNQFPMFMREDGPLIIDFIEKYYDWLDSVGEVGYYKRTLTEQFDVDSANDIFFEFLRNEFLKYIPKKIICDERTLLKYILDFYKSKGSEKSFRLLFRILYNEEIQFYNPEDDVLRADDGRWIVDKVLEFIPSTSFYDEFLSLNDLIGKQIRGSDSKAKARVEKIETIVENGVLIYKMFISNKINKFKPELLNNIVLENIDGNMLLEETRTFKTGYNNVTEYYNVKLDQEYTENEETIYYNNILIGKILKYQESSGKWRDNKGKLDADKYIQDDYYYQDFSYVIRTRNINNTTKQAIRDLVHPAGTILFLEYYDITTIDQFLYPEDEVFIIQNFDINIEKLLNMESNFNIEDLDTEFLLYTFYDNYDIKRTNLEIKFYGSLDSGTVSYYNSYSNATGFFLELDGSGTSFTTYPFIGGDFIIGNFEHSYSVHAIANNTRITLTGKQNNTPFAITNENYLYELGEFEFGAGNIYLLENTFGENDNIQFGEILNITFEDIINRNVIVGKSTTFTDDAPGDVVYVVNSTSNVITHSYYINTIVNNTILKTTSSPYPDGTLPSIYNDKYIKRQSFTITEEDLTE